MSTWTGGNTSRSTRSTSGPRKWTIYWEMPARPGVLLGWEPRVSFRELVRLMVDADIQALIDLRQCQDVIQRLQQENHLGPRGETDVPR